MNVILTQAVDIALRTLGEEDRQSVTAWIDHLKNWEKDEFIRQQSKQLESSGNVYLLKTNTDFRIFFRLEQENIVVLDIATEATLKTFRQLAGQGRP